VPCGIVGCGAVTPGGRAAGERAYAAAQRPGVDASPAAERQHLKKFEEALELWRACGDRAREALTLSHLARIRANLGDMDQAASISLQALELGRATAEAHAQAIALASLGTVARRRGDLQTALATWRRSHCLRARRIGAPR